MTTFLAAPNGSPRAVSLMSVTMWLACFLDFGITGARAAQAPATAGSNEQPQLEVITQQALQQYHLKAIVVRVTYNGKSVYTRALGESMTGVPAQPAMHFRNGAMAFTYMSTMLLELVDQRPGEVSLNNKLNQYLPELPESDRITLKNLANMTSGYADYVYQPEVENGTNLDPFRQWTSDELIQIGVSKPMMFEPGTNWGYSHTNYVILGRVLEKITQMPLAEAMEKYIFGPMGLRQTKSIATPEIPTPVLHAFSSERRQALLIPAGSPFYEESTFWNPSWTTAEGAVQTTDIADMTTTMEAVGTGKLLSQSSWQAQVGPNLVGFGHTDPNCPACQAMTPQFNYGLGVINVGPWITQTKSFAGCDGAVGYLPPQKLSIAVITTYAPEAYDNAGNVVNATTPVLTALVNVLAPNSLPSSMK